MRYPHKVFLLVLSGNAEVCQRRMASHYPDCEIVLLSKRVLREGGWKKVVRELSNLRGEAFIISADNATRLEQSKFTSVLGLFHRCRTTVLDDGSGRPQTFGRWRLIWQLPKLALALLADAITLVAWWLPLQLLKRKWVRPAKINSQGRFSDLDVAVLYPFPLQETGPGGEMSYLKGFLSGLAAESAKCEVFSGCPLPFDIFPVQVIPNGRRFYFFPEAQALSYNLRFFWEAFKHLRNRRPRFLYQRHGRFVVAGILLSRMLRVPLVLEYQCSELWRAIHWDPVHFHAWLRKCEDASIAASSHLVALSDVLRHELLERGVAIQNIVLNPAAVDPQLFHPGAGGPEERHRLGYSAEHVVVGFVGSFSYWHGIVVLQQAIQLLLDRSREKASLRNLRFLLVGDGLLWPEISAALKSLPSSEAITFTGRVPHQRISGLLDACDILVCAHIPPADGTRFFGSPSKLFEYMAMGKGIAASDLDQLSEVLEHGVTAWLVPPGDVEELANAIEMLALGSDLRQRMGQQARATVLNRYTWRHNAARLLSQFPSQPGLRLQPDIVEASPLVQSSRGGSRV